MDALVPSCLRYRDSRQGGMNRACTTNMFAEYKVSVAESQKNAGPDDVGARAQSRGQLPR